MIKDEDAVDMLSTNMEKYFDRARGARIRKMFDYTINLEPNLTEEYVKAGFPGATDGKYYLIDEELKFSVKCLGGTDENYTGDVIRLGFAYDKKSLDGGLLETGQDADFTKSIFNEDLVVEPEAVDFINSIPADKIRDVINDLFMPILRIDNSGDNDDEAQFEVERKSNGFILKFKLDFDRNEASGEHLVSIYFKMPRVWNSIFEVTLVDPTKEPHIKLKYKNGMDVTMYSYLNKESTANVGACIQRAGLYDIAIKELYKMLLSRGYPEAFCDLVTKNLNTDFTASRMIGYLCHYSDLPPEEIADEMLAILSDRNRIMQKKELESNNAEWNRILMQGLDTKDET